MIPCRAGPCFSWCLVSSHSQPLTADKLLITVKLKLLAVWEINYRLDQDQAGHAGQTRGESNNKGGGEWSQKTKQNMNGFMAGELWGRYWQNRWRLPRRGHKHEPIQIEHLFWGVWYQQVIRGCTKSYRGLVSHFCLVREGVKNTQRGSLKFAAKGCKTLTPPQNS